MILDFNNKLSNKNNRHVFRFKTKSKKFKIIYNLDYKGTGNYPHLGISAREGLLVMYKLIDSDIFFNFDVYARKSEIEVNLNPVISSNEPFEVLIYGPILSSISDFKILIDDDFAEIIENNYENSILFAGGKHSFGIGCTTTGVLFSNILSRTLKLKNYKVVFNENNFLDKVYNSLKDESKTFKFDFGILEIDYTNQDDLIVEEYLLKTIQLMQTCCNHIICWYCLTEEDINKKENILNIFNQEINENVILIDFSYFYSRENLDRYTFSKNFINDNANIMIFKRLYETIRGTM